MRFFDASALVKRYVRERQTTQVRRLLAAGSVAVSRLSEVEVPSALARLAREGRLSVRLRDRALTAFLADLAAWHVVELSVAVTALARSRLLQHPIRTGDAIQLASALWLQSALSEPLSGFVAFDDRLIAAATAEGLVARI
jgi:hypothetical protein